MNNKVNDKYFKKYLKYKKKYLENKKVSFQIAGTTENTGKIWKENKKREESAGYLKNIDFDPEKDIIMVMIWGTYNPKEEHFVFKDLKSKFDEDGSIYFCDMGYYTLYEADENKEKITGTLYKKNSIEYEGKTIYEIPQSATGIDVKGKTLKILGTDTKKNYCFFEITE